MSSAPSLSFLKRRKQPSAAWGPNVAQHIEIVAPDQLSTTLLLEYAAPLFPAEHVSGTSWIIRLQPPPAGGKWVIELLSLVERWLKSTNLPSANVVYGGRGYLIRAADEVPTAGPML